MVRYLFIILSFLTVGLSAQGPGQFGQSEQGQKHVPFHLPGTDDKLAERPRIAIVDFKMVGAVEPTMAVIVPELLLTYISREYFELIERASLVKLLEEQSLQMTNLIDSNEQLAQFGKIKGVRYIITGSIIRFGGYTVTARALDAETGEIVSTGTIEAKTEIALRRLLPRLATLLVGEERTTLEAQGGRGDDDPFGQPNPLENVRDNMKPMDESTARMRGVHDMRMQMVVQSDLQKIDSALRQYAMDFSIDVNRDPVPSLHDLLDLGYFRTLPASPIPGMKYETPSSWSQFPTVSGNVPPDIADLLMHPDADPEEAARQRRAGEERAARIKRNNESRRSRSRRPVPPAATPTPRLEPTVEPVFKFAD